MCIRDRLRWLTGLVVRQVHVRLLSHLLRHTWGLLLLHLCVFEHMLRYLLLRALLLRQRLGELLKVLKPLLLQLVWLPTLHFWAQLLPLLHWLLNPLLPLLLLHLLLLLLLHLHLHLHLLILRPRLRLNAPLRLSASGIWQMNDHVVCGGGRIYLCRC